MFFCPNWIFGPVLFSLCFLLSIFFGGASNKGRSSIDLFLLLLWSWSCPSPWLGLSTTLLRILLHAFVVDHMQIHVLHSTAIPTTMSLIFLGCSTVSIALPFRKGTLDPTRFGSKGDRNGFEKEARLGSTRPFVRRTSTMATRVVVACFLAMAAVLRAETDDVDGQDACQTYVEESTTHGCAAQFAAELRDAVRRGGEHEAVVEACRSTCRKDAEDALLGLMAMDCERQDRKSVV